MDFEADEDPFFYGPCVLRPQNFFRSTSSTTVIARDMACQYCMKPLPKCVLCRRHLGTLIPTECPTLGRLSSWFTWCQVCRHGGHMAHLLHWFQSHEECAASGCICRCKLTEPNSVDGVTTNCDGCTHCFISL
ncbi:hypothetical protein AB6A40_009920 [Gnathostoma spinigerum]|uniref:GATOR2 complex protein MIO zinc-ribbon like domain-containing protein n=1 Tax=Gnathostoma spinigerum TaxID=75299 RepID=A0ABD6ETN5_9BILA